MTLLTAIDTLDDRREIRRLLDKLPPARRFQFLQWCCSQVPDKPHKPRPTASWHRMLPTVRAAERGDDDRDNALSNDIYTDILHMAAQYDLDAAAVARRLESVVRRLR